MNSERTSLNEISAGHIGTPFDTSNEMPGQKLRRTEREDVEAEVSTALERWLGIGRRARGPNVMSDKVFARLEAMPREARVRHVVNSIGMSPTDSLAWDVVSDLLPRYMRMKKEDVKKHRVKTHVEGRLRAFVRCILEGKMQASEVLDPDVHPGVDPTAGMGMDDEVRLPRQGVKITDYDRHEQAWQEYSDVYKFIYGMRPRDDLSDYRVEEIEALTKGLIIDYETEIDYELDLAFARNSVDPLGVMEPEEYDEPHDDMPGHASMKRQGRRQSPGMTKRRRRR